MVIINNTKMETLILIRFYSFVVQKIEYSLPNLSGNIENNF